MKKQIPKWCENNGCENAAKNDEKVRPRSENVVPRLAPRLQNEALEPPKFIKNSDLDPSTRQEVAPQASKALPEAKFTQNLTKFSQKNVKNMSQKLTKSFTKIFHKAMQTYIQRCAKHICPAVAVLAKPTGLGLWVLRVLGVLGVLGVGVLGVRRGTATAVPTPA